ncbi:hypothetical protein [Enterococcus faecium]|nr:hypothetical protein [Enterococcus faecium]MCM6878366.1 hypothetical protein [Enterococcus faecium]
MTRYEENFKQMIVELNQTGRSVRGLAKEYGLSEVLKNIKRYFYSCK